MERMTQTQLAAISWGSALTMARPLKTIRAGTYVDPTLVPSRKPAGALQLLVAYAHSHRTERLTFRSRDEGHRVKATDFGKWHGCQTLQGSHISLTLDLRSKNNVHETLGGRFM
jgi:hypothetical protein